MGIVKKRAPLPQCSPNVSFLIGLKQVKTFLLSFYVTLIHKNPKELNPKIRGLLSFHCVHAPGLSEGDARRKGGNYRDSSEGPTPLEYRVRDSPVPGA